MSTRFPVTRSAMALGPHDGAHRVAVRASLSVLVPLLILWQADRIEWSIYAAFGAFTSLYGRNHAGRSRTRMQLELAMLLTAAVGLGAWVGVSEQRAWLAVPVTAVVAGVGSWLSDLDDWHPPGPLFLVFGFAAVASIPHQPADIPIALAVAAASAAFAVVVGFAGGLVRRLRGGESVLLPTLRVRERRQAAPRHVARHVIAVLVSGTIATAVGIGHPYWAMVSAVVPLVARDLTKQLERALQRVVGTAAGLVLAAALLSLDVPELGLVLLVVVLQAGAELLVGRNYALALVAITPLALLMVHLASPTPMRTLLFDRGVETVIGVGIGVLVGYLTRKRSGLTATGLAAP